VFKLYRDSLETNPNYDYANWPVALGAPVDGLGRPLMIGDQTLWCVYNDADTANRDVYKASEEPLGLEIQQTVWATDEPGDYVLPGPTVIAVEQSGSSRIDITIDIVDTAVLTGHDYLMVTDSVVGDGVRWSLFDQTSGTYPVADRPFTFPAVDTISVDGFRISITLALVGRSWSYTSADPPNVAPGPLPGPGNERWFTGEGDLELLEGGVGLAHNFYGSDLPMEEITPVEIRWRPWASYTDLNEDGFLTPGEPYVVDDTGLTQLAYAYTRYWDATSFTGLRRVPFTAWDVSDSLNPRQLNVVLRDRDENGQWDLHYPSDGTPPGDTVLPNNGDMRFNYLWIAASDYDSTGNAYGDGLGDPPGFFEGDGRSLDGMWALWLGDNGTGGQLAEEGTLSLGTDLSMPPDTIRFTAMKPEVRTTGPDGVSVYLKYRLYNRGGNTIDSCYFALWADPDLGNSADDLCGCDSLGSSFYCYNETNSDLVYSTAPPALGFRFLHGPVVPSTGDTAVFDGHTLADFRNLPMTSYITLFHGADPESPAQAWNLVTRGIKAYGPDPIIYDGDTLMFDHSGDPVSGTGHLDQYSDDRRQIGACGPFHMNPGDSQYVLIKMSVGKGTDNLSSITVLKEILNDTLEIPTGVDDEVPSTLPDEFRVGQNYPNPFNPSTVIEFDLPSKSKVTVSVFNVLGRRVATLLNEERPAGSGSIVWDGTNDGGEAVASGVYFYRVRAGEQTIAKKMMLLK